MKTIDPKKSFIFTAQRARKIKDASKVFPDYDESYIASLVYPEIDMFKYLVHKLKISKSIDEVQKALSMIKHVFNDTNDVVRETIINVVKKIISRTSKISQLIKLAKYCIENDLTSLVNLVLVKINFDVVFKTNSISRFYRLFYSIPSIDRDENGVWYYDKSLKGKYYSETVKQRAREIFEGRDFESYSPEDLKKYFILTMSCEDIRNFWEYGIYQQKHLAKKLADACLRSLKSSTSAKQLIRLLIFSTYRNVGDDSRSIPVEIINKALTLRNLSRAELLNIFKVFKEYHERQHGWNQKSAESLMIRIITKCHPS